MFEKFKRDYHQFGSYILDINKNREKVLKFYRENYANDPLVKCFLKVIDRTEELNPVKNKNLSLIIRYDYMFDKIEKEFR